MLKNGPQNRLQEPIKSCSKTVQILDLFLCWFVKNGPQKWQLFQHKFIKNLIFRGVRNRPRICLDLDSLLNGSPTPSNRQNIEKTLGFTGFFNSIKNPLVFMICKKPLVYWITGFWHLAIQYSNCTYMKGVVNKRQIWLKTNFREKQFWSSRNL